MKLASVILDIPTQALDAPYTYAVPEEAGDQPIEVGCAVLVPFGPRQAVGFVIGIEERAEGDWPAGLDPAKLKGIVRAVSRPYFDEEGAACAQWLSERYIAPLSSCVRLFTPPGGVPRMVRAQGGYWRLEEPTVGEVDDRWVVPGPALADFEPRKNAVKQASIAAALERGELRVAELTAEFGAVSSPLKALEKQGVVRIEHRRRMRGFQVPSACRPTELLDAARRPGAETRRFCACPCVRKHARPRNTAIFSTRTLLADFGWTRDRRRVMTEKTKKALKLPEAGQWPDRIAPTVLVAGAVLSTIGFLLAFLWASPVNGAAVNGVEMIGGQMVTSVLLLSQKIFYFHMPVAITSFIALAFAGYYAVRFLMTKNRRFDTCSKIAMEIALLFVACTMITGDLWTRFEWGVWWTWDPRLTTYLILMLIIIAYFILRNAIDEPERRATYGAVLSIIALIDVPICFMVTRLIPSSIHPVVVREGGMSADMGITLMFCLVGIMLIGFALYRFRFRQVRLTERVEALKEQLED